MVEIGEMVHLKSVLTNVHIFGVVTDGETPDQFCATLEIAGENATMSLAALEGPAGPQGQHAFALRLQRSIIDDPEDLPQNLTDLPEDLGKYWIMNHYDDEDNLIGSRAYIWFGDHYRVLMMGSEGPPGPVPKITWGFELLDPDGEEDTHVIQTGTAYNPSVLVKAKVPRGPMGPASAISLAPDVDMTTPPQNGQVLAWNGEKWAPMSVGAIIPRPFIIPEAAFTNYEGLSTRAPIGSFAVPALPFAWKPWVVGKIRARGLELDSDPLIIGCEVRLGHPTSGQLVARGFGNNSGWTILTPHTSEPSSPSTAMTPDNQTALVPANHTGNDGTLYINLYNDGIVGVYLFNRTNAQIGVMAVPV